MWRVMVVAGLLWIGGCATTATTAQDDAARTTLELLLDVMGAFAPHIIY